MRRLLIVTAASFAIAAAGLTGPSVARKPRPTGTIEGKVVYDGTPPKRGKVKRGPDPVCKKNKTPDPSLVVAKDGGVREVFVQVEGMVSLASPSDAVVIEQTGCEYTPRVVGVVTGQKLLVKNGDKTLHNVHAYFEGDTAWNLAQPKQAKPIARAMDEAGLLELKCDVHPWMRAWAVYVDHTGFDVTGDDGSFRIDNVPVGKYTVSAWHPTLGKRSVDVTVKKRRAATAEIRFDGK